MKKWEPADKIPKKPNNHLISCPRDNFQVARVQAKGAKAERVDPIPTNDIHIHKAAGILPGASYRVRPAGCRKRRNYFRR